jgi:hypothetical protein
MGATHFIQRLTDFKANSWLKKGQQQTSCGTCVYSGIHMQSILAML